ncbi:hypothetical protein LOAG_05549 [Loa loa]|uniref:Uncharacterized protein n=1 Tax=Loa loa TaxID=7209 RepID=A0A1S0TZP0_LOALO|nr:hypothetical protein LOAG_05549 [Loa loa]EFO22938.1 hypothetical protein LOAG_05549 [Loa loa]
MSCSLHSSYPIPASDNTSHCCCPHYENYDWFGAGDAATATTTTTTTTTSDDDDNGGGGGNGSDDDSDGGIGGTTYYYYHYYCYKCCYAVSCSSIPDFRNEKRKSA